MVAPPFDVGAVKAMLALAFPAVPTKAVGAPGTVTLAVPEGAAVLEPPPQADRVIAMSGVTRR
jgi:hypothetical protein